jgi:hypothetical protein
MPGHMEDWHAQMQLGVLSKWGSQCLLHRGMTLKLLLLLLLLLLSQIQVQGVWHQLPFHC